MDLDHNRPLQPVMFHFMDTWHYTESKFTRMRPAFIALLAVQLLIHGSATVAVDEVADKQRKATWLFQLDNDLFTNSDSNYTNGVRFALMRPIESTSLKGVLRPLNEMTGSREGGFFSRLSALTPSPDVQWDWGIGLTQLMFTPDDPQALSAPPGQRPYAGWLGLELSLHAKDVRALNSVILSIGVTGDPSLAQEAQDWVHRNISHSPIFQGWDSQVPTEVTVNLNFDRKRRLHTLGNATADWPVNMDGYLEWGLGIGNFRTDAYVGALVRMGYNLPASYMKPQIQLGTYAHQLFLSERVTRSNWSIGIFMGGRATAVAHDITLDGPLFRSHDGVRSETLVAEWTAGIGIRYRHLTFSFARTARTHEFVGQLNNHRFGSMLVSFEY
jgi:hypothetical protein